MIDAEEMYEIRYALGAKDGEGTREAARRVDRERNDARDELALIWTMVGSPRDDGARGAIRKLVDDREGNEARKALGLILDELGQRPGDHLGALRALRAREGAGGKLREIRDLIRTSRAQYIANVDDCRVFVAKLMEIVETP